MAGIASHAGRAKTVRPANDERDVQAPCVGLPRTVSGRMAIHATRRVQHLAGLFEQCDRSLVLIRDARETYGRAQLVGPGSLWGLTGRLIPRGCQIRSAD